MEGLLPAAPSFGLSYQVSGVSASLEPLSSPCSWRLLLLLVFGFLHIPCWLHTQQSFMRNPLNHLSLDFFLSVCLSFPARIRTNKSQEVVAPTRCPSQVV